MEFLTTISQSAAMSAATILPFLIFLYTVVQISRTLQKNNTKNNECAVPQAGLPWPMIGHLQLLRGSEPSHRILGKMADKYGPIFGLKMGVHKAVVVSSWEIAKQCLTTRDKVFASRPKTVATEVLGYNSLMIGFSPYGSYWRQTRKLATLELLSKHRLEKLKHVREAEINTSITDLYQIWVDKRSSNTDGSNKVLVEMKKWIKKVTLNVILKMVVGKRCSSSPEREESDRWIEGLKRFSELSGVFTVSDALPFLRWLDIGGGERLMKKTYKELDVVVQAWLDEHKRNRVSGEMNKDEDFMDVMLSLMDEAESFPMDDADTIIKSTCLALIIAAADTTADTLTWALSLLLNHREVLKKAREELDIQVGKKRQVKESDLENLVYLQAIIKETMRLYPAAPLAIPHESLQDCIVNGYHVQKGTRRFINLWKIQRDPRVWLNPCEYQPERFLTTCKDFDVRGQNFEFIPFGSGRRMCPGVSFALQVLQLTLASLIHEFDFETPSDEPIDMSEGIALTIIKKSPLEIFLAPRPSTFSQE